ncbi:hypothetical protein Taro_045399 [Colocasia esculenta]|uniref:Mediator complex subunit 15 KIX domain-containing protein n=1 Tax=Colocasia esculenta TaxID=4460 RepID=A0A843X059_COLES|nr:hypothetical protein [Colocasia esculenta]
MIPPHAVRSPNRGQIDPPMDGGGSNEMPALAGAPFVNVDFMLDVWRAELGGEARNRIINKIVETLRRYVQASRQVLPISELDLSWELMRMAVKFEEKIFIIAESKVLSTSLKHLCFKDFIGDEIFDVSKDSNHYVTDFLCGQRREATEAIKGSPQPQRPG